MTTVYLSAGPVPHPMRVTVMQPPPASSRARETGYSFAVPDTWYRAEFEPSTAPWQDLWYHNSGWSSPPWESGGTNISSGFTVRAPMLRHRVSGGMGPVEVGSAEVDARWCCPWGHFWCDAQDCIDEDIEAAQNWVEQTDGGGVVAPPDEARDRIRELYDDREYPTSEPCAHNFKQVGTKADGSPLCERKARESKDDAKEVIKPPKPKDGSGRSEPLITTGIQQPPHLTRYWKAYALGAAALAGLVAWRLTR